MIRKTLNATKSATWCISLANDLYLPIPTGTGFFISDDGWLITAAHVVCDERGNIRQNDVVNGDLTQHPSAKDSKSFGAMNGMSVHWINQQEDIALIKIDWDRSMSQMQKQLFGGVSFLKISVKELEEGTPVYSFGYPLSDFKLTNFNKSSEGTVAGGQTYISPRTTSAIVSSISGGQEIDDPNIKVYILDKALNYGNSGGPIINAETGNVHAICSRFHPVFIPQSHVLDGSGNPINIMIPSLYGYASSIANLGILEELKKIGIEVEE